MAKSFDKKGIMKATGLALLASILGIVVLGWQYNQLAKRQLPELEEKMEFNLAKDILRRYLETRSDILLTERAMEQKTRGEFFLENIKYYEILETEKKADGQYQFQVKVGSFIQIITVTKILGSYYIDSIETAG